MTPKPDPAPSDDDDGMFIDDSSIATPPQYLTDAEVARLVREAQERPAAPLPGTPEYLAVVDKLKREIDERTGTRGDGVLDLDGDDWRQEVRKGRRKR